MKGYSHLHATTSEKIPHKLLQTHKQIGKYLKKIGANQDMLILFTVFPFLFQLQLGLGN